MGTFLDELKIRLLRGVKFGLVVLLTGLILHVLWGNLEEVKYTMATGLFIGFIIGSIEHFFYRSAVQRFAYSIIFLLRACIYFIIIIVCVYVIFVIYLKTAGFETTDLGDPQKFERISSVYFLAHVNILYILTFTLAATFVWQLKSFFGKGVLFNYLIGKYHKPTIEERIFMFLDLNDATVLGEKLGSKRYSSLLSDFFQDIDTAFTSTHGQVFQYVGDEVVIIWNSKEGLKKNNCLSAYFIALKSIKDKKEYYLEKYGTVPTFKAALHLGDVTISEMGVSKKEIVYHGDTINTTSRICAHVHELGKRLLISKVIYDNLTNTNDVAFEDCGEHSFKGKEKKIHVYGI